MKPLTRNQKEIIRALANNDMHPVKAARELYMHRNTVEYQSKKIHNATGLNPLKFFDLIVLLKMCE